MIKNGLVGGKVMEGMQLKIIYASVRSSFLHFSASPSVDKVVRMRLTLSPRGYRRPIRLRMLLQPGGEPAPGGRAEPQHDPQVGRVRPVEDALPCQPGGDKLVERLVAGVQYSCVAQRPGVVGRLQQARDDEGLPDTHAARQAQSDEEGGRGLALVEALSDRWDWTMVPGWSGKVVWAEILGSR